MRATAAAHPPQDRRFRRLGKVVVIVAFGGWWGHWYHNDVLARKLEATGLPAELDPSCPLSPATLTSQSWPGWADMVLFIVTLLLFFGLYEALGQVAGRLVQLGAGGIEAVRSSHRD